MTSTKIFSARKTSILVVAIFTMAITIGLGPISSSMASSDFINCNVEKDDNANDGQTSVTKSCHEEVNKGDDNSNGESSDQNGNTNAAASNNDDNDGEQDSDNADVVKSTPQNVANLGPAVASSDDNIIKPINLNKGLDSDKPLQTNNAKHVQSNNNDDEIKSKKTIEDKMQTNFNNKLSGSSSVSELYNSFDLPYTALYKN